MKPITPNRIWDDLKPRIVALIEERAGVRTVSSGGSGSGSLSTHDLGGAFHSGTLRNDQALQFLLLDGTRDLTGNLAVSSGVTIDGVDLSAHASNPDAHHAKIHALATNSALGPDHTISGATAGHVLRASSGTAAAFAQLQHTDLGGVTSDQHHAKLHAMLDTAHHSYSGGAAFDVFGLSAASTLAKLTPSSNPGGTGALLRTDGSGYLALVRLTTTDRLRSPLLDTASGDLTVQPAANVVLSPGGDKKVNLASGVAVQSDNYQSQLVGMRATYAGEGDFRYLFADEMHVKSFIADLEQALAGGQIIGKSVTWLTRDFTAPAAAGTATLYLHDLPSAEGMAVFQSGDVIRLRQFSRSGGSLSVSDCWGTVSSYTDLADKEQSWTFTRSSAPNAGAMSAGTVVKADATVLDYGVSGNGFYEVNSIDGANAQNSPYARIVRWTGHPATGQTTVAQMGNLRGLFNVADEYGFYAGLGVTDADAYLRLSSYTTRFNNLDTRWYNGGVSVVRINTSDGVSVKVNAAAAYDDIRAYTLVNASEATLGGLYGYDASNVQHVAVRSDTTSASRTAQVGLYANNTAAGTVQAQMAATASDGSAYVTLTKGQAYIQATSGGASKAITLDSAGLALPAAVTAGGYAVWHAGNDGDNSGLDADLLDGFDLSDIGGSSKVLRTRSDGYLQLDSWIRQSVGQGLFGDTSPYAPHFFSNNDGWIAQSANASLTWLQLRSGSGTIRGYLYANNSNEVGLLDYAGGWRVKATASTVDLYGEVTITSAGEHKLAKSSNTYLYAQAISADRVRMGAWDSGGAVARKLCLNEYGGFVGIACSDPAVELDVNGYSIRVRNNYTPASAGATGVKGQICYDSSYVYVCTATNTWKRAALSSW